MQLVKLLLPEGLWFVLPVVSYITLRTQYNPIYHLKMYAGSTLKRSIRLCWDHSTINDHVGFEHLDFFFTACV